MVIMAKVNQDLLRDRLPSILYLKAYPEVRSINQIAQEVYGQENRAIHFYRWRDRFLDKDWMEQTEDGVLSLPDPLIEDLQKKLGAKLDESLQTILYKILDSYMFRDTLRYVEWAVRKYGVPNPVDPQKGIDAPKVIFSSLTELTASAYMVASMRWLYPFTDEKPDKEMSIEEISQKLKLPSPTDDEKTITMPGWVIDNYQKKLSDEDFKLFERFSLMGFPRADGSGFSPTSMYVLPLLCLPKYLLRRISRITLHGRFIVDAWERAFGVIASLKCKELEIKNTPIQSDKDPDIVRELVSGALR